MECLSEPVGRQTGDLFELPFPFKEVAGACNDVQFLLAGEPIVGLAVEFKYLRVGSADDEQRWCSYLVENLFG